MHFEIPKTSWLGGRYGVLFFTILVAVAFFAMWSYQVLDGEKRAISAAESNAQNLAHAIEDSSARTIQAVDLILSNVGAGLQPGGWALGKDSKKFMQSLLNEAPQVREIAFTDTSGRITHLSRRGKLPELSIAAEPYFERAKEELRETLLISKAHKGRLLHENDQHKMESQHWHLIATRTVLDDLGNFAGVAIAVINPNFFLEQINALDIGHRGAVLLYRYDGELLIHSHQDAFSVERANHSSNTLFTEHLPIKEWGTFHTTKRYQSEHSKRVVSYRATTRWPLLVAVELDLEEALLSWRRDVQNYTAAIAAGLVVLLALGAIAYHQRASVELAEKQLQLLGTALKTTANMVLITDIDATVVWVNDSFCDHFGYERDEVIGKKPNILKSGLVPPNVIEDMWETILGRRTWNGELINKRKDGTLLIVNQTVSPIVDDHNHITHFVAIHDDITQRKESEIELREAKLNAEAANTVKTQFLANMSHELRTPLNAVLGFIDLMRMETFGPLGHDKYREYSNDIHTSASHLLTLIADILDVSKIEAGKMDLSEENIDLEQLADGCCKLLSPRAKADRINLSYTIPNDVPKLWADNVRIKQIVLNLLTNSIKFTPRDGSVILAVELAKDGGVIIRVEDNGIGIAPDELSRILEPFGQARDNNTIAHEGVGLGLYLVQKFAEMHGGRIDVISELGIGTQVSVIMPTVRSQWNKKQIAAS
ncbi:MAG: ATP-binding protein [Magnetovibrio sp.]|nr:ATP-binding protein [Magnetovibrio sp.]